MTKFVNISNHPIAGWTDKQKQAAKDLFPAGSEIEFQDWGFPNIDPRKDTQQVFDDYILPYGRRIMEMILFDKSIQDIKIHLMGEQTFCCGLATYLYDCDVGDILYVSTTERITEEKDGVKTSRFEFVQFRRLYR